MNRRKPPSLFGTTRFQRGLWIAIFLLPAVLLMAVFTVVPAVAALSYSFYSWTSFSRGEWVGLANFQKLFTFPFQGQFFNAMGHNFIAFAGLMVVQNGLGLLLAYALWRQPPGFKFFRVTVFLPVILSLVIVGFLWQLILHPLFGPFNKLLTAVGLGQFAVAWLGESETALATLILVNAWRWVGFPTLVFLANMNAIPEDYYEAARLDGASESQIFRRITLPLLAPAFTVIFLLTFIGAMEWFELPYVMSGVTGPPGGATDTLALMFYRLAFGGLTEAVSDVGLASAINVLLFLVVGVGSVAAALYLRRREVES